MIKQKTIILFLLISPPFLLWGQYPTPSKPKKEQLTFSSPQKKQTKFRKKYIGTLNGRTMELKFIEKKPRRQLYLFVILTDLLSNEVFVGKTIIHENTYLLKDVLLKNKQQQTIQIEHLFLHNYNPNFINLITKNGLAGCFAWDAKKRYVSNSPAKRFSNKNDFKGYYEGRIDGRLAELRIENRGTGVLFNLFDKEHKTRYWTYLPALPKETLGIDNNQEEETLSIDNNQQNGILSIDNSWQKDNFADLPKEINQFSLSNIDLKSTTNVKELTIGRMILDTETNQIISGHFIIKNKPVGLFFIRRLPATPTLIPEFPWPPPTASDVVKIPDDLLFHTDSLGGINQLISRSLDKSGYRFRPNKYFYTPNGFALVTALEKVDCDATPLEGDNRWNTNPSEFENNFTLLDYLRSLVVKDEALYRVFVFIVTDDLNLSKSIEPSVEETQGWLVAGSAVLPTSIANTPLNDNHYCRAYVYEFSKIAGQIQATMVRKGDQSCWRSGETHLKNTKILEHLVIRP